MLARYKVSCKSENGWMEGWIGGWRIFTKSSVGNIPSFRQSNVGVKQASRRLKSTRFIKFV